jgi:hypothetical protein
MPRASQSFALQGRETMPQASQSFALKGTETMVIFNRVTRTRPLISSSA